MKQVPGDCGIDDDGDEVCDPFPCHELKRHQFNNHIYALRLSLPDLRGMLFVLKDDIPLTALRRP